MRWLRIRRRADSTTKYISRISRHCAEKLTMMQYVDMVEGSVAMLAPTPLAYRRLRGRRLDIRTTDPAALIYSNTRLAAYRITCRCGQLEGVRPLATSTTVSVVAHGRHGAAYLDLLCRYG